jgi:hypothetical protein
MWPDDPEDKKPKQNIIKETLSFMVASFMTFAEKFGNNHLGNQTSNEKQLAGYSKITEGLLIWQGAVEMTKPSSSSSSKPNSNIGVVDDIALSSKGATNYVELAASTENAVMGTGEGGLNLFKFGSQQATKSTGWRSGDYFLNLPNKGTPKLNWKANYGALRSEMNLEKPIFDSYKLPNGNLISTGGFLNAERYTLQSRGWMYSPGKGSWMPPP